MEYERDAINGKPMPKGLSGYDQGVYLALRALYANYHAKVVTREEAMREKRLILREFGEARRRMRFDRELSDHTVNLWKTIGDYNGAYCRERTLDNADALSKAIYGLLRLIPMRPAEMRCPRCGYEFEEKRPKFCEECGIPLNWEGAGSHE